MKLIILALLLSSFVGGESPVNPPELLPECISEYTLIWKFDNSVYCQEQDPWGDYYLYSCHIQKYSEFHQEYYETLEFVSQCIYVPDKLIPQEEFTVFMPLVATNHTIMSYIP